MWCICGLLPDDYRRDVLKNSSIARMAGAPRWMIVLSVSLVMTMGGALGIVRATQSTLDDVNRVAISENILSPATDGIENYLLVGSDSRASAQPDDPDYEVVGSEAANPGQRSDTMIVVNYNTKTGGVATMSIPRDLWARMGDTSRFNKINAAYQKGPDVLVRTVQRALNIPIHHYIDVNFSGFKQIVDSIGGVHICVARASRDQQTGFYIGRKACKLQTGEQALRYARSRHFQEKVDGKWREDPTGDVGRSTRQRAFMSALAKDAAKYLLRHPLRTHEVMSAMSSAVAVDGGLSLLDLAKKLRPLGDGTSQSYTLPVDSDMDNGTFVFRLNRDAQPLLAYFAGLGPTPAPAS